MSGVVLRAIFAAILITPLLACGARAQTCPSPNPNLAAPPFTPNCPLPAAALNRLTAGTGVPVAGNVPSWVGVPGVGYALGDSGVPVSTLLPHVDNNAELLALASTAFPEVYRAGFYAAGDGGAALYVSSPSLCSLNAGAGDNGAQVKAFDGNCWIATSSVVYDVRQWGAKCDGTTDDAATINAALAARSVIRIPAGQACGYSSTINVPTNGKLVGAGHNSSVLVAKVPNINGISLNGNYSGIESLAINCGASGSNTSGNCINVAGSFREVLIRDFAVLAPFYGVVTTTSVLVTIEDGYIYNPTAATGECIVINGGNNQVIINTFCQGVQAAQPRAGTEIIASGGVWLINNQSLFAGTGELIDPGSSQTVTWIFEHQGTYDSGSGNGISIAPAAAGVVRGYYCTECWTSTNTLSGFVAQPGGGTVDDVHLDSHRSYNNMQYGAVFATGVLNAFVQGGSFCGNSASGSNTYDGIYASSVTHLNINAARSGVCAGFSSLQKYGIEVAAGGADTMVLGNDVLNNVTAGLSYTASAPCIVQGNLGVNNASYAATCTGQ